MLKYKLGFLFIFGVTIATAVLPIELDLTNYDSFCAYPDFRDIRLIVNDSIEVPYQLFNFNNNTRLLVYDVMNFELYCNNREASFPNYSYPPHTINVTGINSPMPNFEINSTVLAEYITNLLTNLNFSLYQDGPISLILFRNMSYLENDSDTRQYILLYPNQSNIFDTKFTWTLLKQKYKCPCACFKLLYFPLTSENFNSTEPICGHGELFGSNTTFTAWINDNDANAHFEATADGLSICSCGRSGLIGARIALVDGFVQCKDIESYYSIQTGNLTSLSANEINLSGNLLDFERNGLTARISWIFTPIDNNQTPAAPSYISYDSLDEVKTIRLDSLNGEYKFDGKIWFSGESIQFPFESYTSNMSISGRVRLNKLEWTEIKGEEPSAPYKTDYKIETNKITFRIQHTMAYLVQYFLILGGWIILFYTLRRHTIASIMAGLIPYIASWIFLPSFVIFSIGSVLFLVPILYLILKALINIICGALRKFRKGEKMKKVLKRLQSWKLRLKELEKVNHSEGEKEFSTIKQILERIIDRIYPQNDAKRIKEKFMCEVTSTPSGTSEDSSTRERREQESYLEGINKVTLVIETILEEAELFGIRDFKPIKEKEETEFGVGLDKLAFWRKKKTKE